MNILCYIIDIKKTKLIYKYKYLLSKKFGIFKIKMIRNQYLNIL